MAEQRKRSLDEIFNHIDQNKVRRAEENNRQKQQEAKAAEQARRESFKKTSAVEKYHVYDDAYDDDDSEPVVMIPKQNTAADAAKKGAEMDELVSDTPFVRNSNAFLRGKQLAGKKPAQEDTTVIPRVSFSPAPVPSEQPVPVRQEVAHNAVPAPAMEEDDMELDMDALEDDSATSDVNPAPVSIPIPEPAPAPRAVLAVEEVNPASTQQTPAGTEESFDTPLVAVDDNPAQDYEEPSGWTDLNLNQQPEAEEEEEEEEEDPRYDEAAPFRDVSYADDSDLDDDEEFDPSEEDIEDIRWPTDLEIGEDDESGAEPPADTDDQTANAYLYARFNKKTLYGAFGLCVDLGDSLVQAALSGSTDDEEEYALLGAIELFRVLNANDIHEVRIYTEPKLARCMRDNAARLIKGKSETHREYIELAWTAMMNVTIVFATAPVRSQYAQLALATAKYLSHQKYEE